MSNKSSSSSGISLGGFVFLIFLTLKLAEIGPVATWSWWWVTAPLWIPFGIAAIVVVLFLVFGGIIALFGVIATLFSRKKVTRYEDQKSTHRFRIR